MEEITDHIVQAEGPDVARQPVLEPLSSRLILTKMNQQGSYL